MAVLCRGPLPAWAGGGWFELWLSPFRGASFPSAGVRFVGARRYSVLLVPSWVALGRPWDAEPCWLGVGLPLHLCGGGLSVTSLSRCVSRSQLGRLGAPMGRRAVLAWWALSCIGAGGVRGFRWTNLIASDVLASVRFAALVLERLVIGSATGVGAIEIHPLRGGRRADHCAVGPWGYHQYRLPKAGCRGWQPRTVVREWSAAWWVFVGGAPRTWFSWGRPGDPVGASVEGRRLEATHRAGLGQPALTILPKRAMK